MTVFLLSTLVPAFAAQVDRVPEDFATIQEAVSEGTAPMIEVGPGDWKGAAIDRPVAIIGHHAKIISGPTVRGAHAGFTVNGDADGSEIRGFDFACTSNRLDLGVYANTPILGKADNIVIAENTFNQCVQGVTNRGRPHAECKPEKINGGSLWLIEDNEFNGFSTTTDNGRSGGGLGIYIQNARAADVIGNTFSGWIQDTSIFSTSGVSVAGCVDCTIAANDFKVKGGKFYWTAVSNLGFFNANAAASTGLIVADNDASADTAPHNGVNYRSYDSFDTAFSENAGVAYVDHTHCGDDALELIE